MTDHDQIVTWARGLVTGGLLLVDDSGPWRASLSLLATGGAFKDRAIGAILVPVADHRVGYWINGKVPAVTLTCTIVRPEDIDALRAECDRMQRALWPE